MRSPLTFTSVIIACCIWLQPSPLPAAAASGGSPEVVQKLVDTVKSGASQKEKADACRELARIADKSAVAALGALLPDESLSHMARYALETIPDPEVDKVFRASLDKLQGRPLTGVIGSIGVRGDTKAVKALSRHLTAADPDVAQAAARALGKIGDSAAAKALRSALPSASPANQVAFCEGLLRCAENLAKAGKRKQATEIYDSLRSSAAGHQVRTAALRGAILTRQKDGISLLTASLKSSDFAEFAAAARTSLEMQGAAVTETLTSALPKSSADKQILLIQLLGQRGDPDAVGALSTAAREYTLPVRVAAIRALAELGDLAAMPTLLDLMTAGEREVAQAALEALGALPGKQVDTAVLGMLRGSDQTRRNAALDLVVRRRMASAIPELYKLAGQPDQGLRVGAVRRIAELGDQRQVPEMLVLLTKASATEDLEAIEQALGTIAVKAPDRDSSAVTISDSLKTSQALQRAALVRVLGNLGGSTALKSVRGALNDSSAEVRTAAIRTLGNWPSAEAAPDLLQLARSASEPKERVLSLRSYLSLASQAEIPADNRLSMCRDAAELANSPDEKKLLLAALGGIRSPEALPLIVAHLGDSAIKEEAAVAATSVAGKLLEGNDAGKNAAGVVEALQKVSAAGVGPETTRRAQSLLEKAQKAGNK